jgi:hypothetical protein
VPEGIEHLVAAPAQDLGALVVALVDAMIEAYQSERVVLVLGATHNFGDAIDRSYLGHALQDAFVGAAIRPPQGGDRRRCAGIGGCPRRADEPHR